MPKKKRQAAKKKKSGSFTPLWARIVAIGCAVLILGTAVPLAILFFH